MAKQKEVLEKIEHCSKSETEKILVREFGVKALPPKRELVQSTTGDEALLHVRLKQETLKKLDRLKNLRAHKNPKMSYADLIDDMCTYMLKKLDPSERTVHRQHTRNTDLSAKLGAVGVARSSNSRYIPPVLKCQIWRRDQGRCTYTEVKSGKRCESRHLLQFDHIQPVCCGGEATEQNLRLLCHAHHRFRDANV